MAAKKCSSAYILRAAVVAAWAVIAPAEILAQRYSDAITAAPVPDSSEQIADRIVQSKLPVVVDFWAPWCAPCRIVNPVIEKLERAYRGRVLFMKVNADYNRQLAAYLGVQGIPAVFIVRDKAVRQMLVGVREEAEYRQAIESVLAMPSPDDAEKRQNAPGKAPIPTHSSGEAKKAE